jgi:hypothetical protein
MAIATAAKMDATIRAAAPRVTPDGLLIILVCLPKPHQSVASNEVKGSMLLRTWLFRRRTCAI